MKKFLASVLGRLIIVGHAGKRKLKWSTIQKLRRFALNTILNPQDYGPQYKMAKENYFYIGQMVESIPKYCLGSPRVQASLEYAFDGVGIIVDINWPDEAYVYTNKGDVLCLNTSRLVPIENKKD